MKRSKNDHIRSTISRYFKRRQFHETEMPSRKESRREQAITDLSVRRRTRSRTSVENTLGLSSITGDATAFEQQYFRLSQFLTSSSSPYWEELQALLFPMFVHVYLEMLCNGHKVPAHKFHDRYSDSFSSDKEVALLKRIKTLETKADVLNSKDVTQFRENRILLELSRNSLEYLMRHLRTEDNIGMLQMFNQHVKVKPKADTSNKQEMMSLPDTTDDTVVKGERTNEEGERNLQEDLTAAIKAVRELPPCLPSICFFTFLNTYQGLTAATISSDKKRLSGSFEDSSISVWSLEPDVFKRTPGVCDVSQIVLGADHVLNTEREIRERLEQRPKSNYETAKLIGHRGPVYKTRFLSDSSKYLLSCSEDTSVRLWDMASQTNACIYQGHSSAVWDLNCSSTDVWFASCSHDTTAKLWTPDRTFPLRSFVGHTSDVDCIEFHPNNNYVATGSGDKTIRFWSVTEGRTVRLLQGHRGSVLALAFSPNGKLLASAGEDRRIRVWDLGTGHVMKELRGHSDTVYALAFDENSSVLASGGADCCVRLWDMNRLPDLQSTEGHSSPELLGAFPSKSSLISYLSYAPFNVLMAAGASS